MLTGIASPFSKILVAGGPGKKRLSGGDGGEHSLAKGSDVVLLVPHELRISAHRPAKESRDPHEEDMLNSSCRLLKGPGSTGGDS